MKILIFGGNRFCGKLIVKQLYDEGHDVTVLNRSGTAPVDCKIIKADRNKIHNFDYYDSVIDMCLYNTEQAEKIEKINTQQYIFMSSIAVYYEHFGEYGKKKNKIENFLKKTDLPLVIFKTDIYFRN